MPSQKWQERQKQGKQEPALSRENGQYPLPSILSIRKGKQCEDDSGKENPKDWAFTMSLLQNRVHP